VALSVLRQSSGLKAQAPQGTDETRQNGMSAVAVRLTVTSLTDVRDRIQNNRRTSETYGWSSAEYSPIPRGREGWVPFVRSELFFRRFCTTSREYRVTRLVCTTWTYRGVGHIRSVDSSEKAIVKLPVIIEGCRTRTMFLCWRETEDDARIRRSTSSYARLDNGPDGRF